MGADFIWALCPKCDLTISGRKKVLNEVVDKLTNNDVDLDEYGYLNINEYKNSLRSCLISYMNFQDSREVGIYDDFKSPIWLTGGISWGDSPTDAFDIMETICTSEKMFQLLKKWAKEDSKND